MNLWKPKQQTEGRTDTRVAEQGNQRERKGWNFQWPEANIRDVCSQCAISAECCSWCFPRNPCPLGTKVITGNNSTLLLLHAVHLRRPSSDESLYCFREHGPWQASIFSVALTIFLLKFRGRFHNYRASTGIRLITASSSNSTLVQ